MTSKKRKMNETFGRCISLRNRNVLGVGASCNGASARTSSSVTELSIEDSSPDKQKSDDVNINLLTSEDEEKGRAQQRHDYSNKLLGILNSMRDNSTLCDYEIRINDESIACHKFMLIAMSDFFRVMLTGSMRESRENFVNLKGFDTSAGVRSIVDYFYSGNLPLANGNIIAILDAASHLQAHDVLNLCSEYLCSVLADSNCVSILKLADTYSLNDVCEKCKTYLGENLLNIYRNHFDQFNQLTETQLEWLLNSDCLNVASELDLFLMIVKWLESPSSTPSSSSSGDERTSRLKHAAHLMKSIRFMCMSAEQLADHVETVSLMREDAECNMLLINAYKYHALPRRQPLTKSIQTKLRNQETLICVGETNLYALNEKKRKWESISDAPLEDNYRNFSFFLLIRFNLSKLFFHFLQYT